MDLVEVLVALGGLAAIAAVNFYFLTGKRVAAAASRAGEGPQQARVVVRGGYQPAEVRLRAGAPSRLVFDRQEESSCSEEVAIPMAGIQRFLPAYEATSIELPPLAAGRYEFTCGMGMLRGRIVVEGSADSQEDRHAA